MELLGSGWVGGGEKDGNGGRATEEEGYLL